MASFLPDANLTRTRELGKYSQATESQNGNERPHEKRRPFTAEEVDIIRNCSGCGKNMPKVKKRFVCSCKEAIHCSKDCLKSTKHRCGELDEVENTASEDQASTAADYVRNRSVMFNEVMNGCYQRYNDDRNAGKGPSSDKVAWLKRVTRGDQNRILRYADSGNPTAAYVVGRAYGEREFDRRRGFAIPRMFEEQSVAETDEIAVKWLKLAAEGGIPEAMYYLFVRLTVGVGLRVDRRVAEYWLAQAHTTGEMDYLKLILEVPRGGCCFPTELHVMYNQIEMGGDFILGATLTHMLMAARFREIKAWGGKTAMKEPFYGWDIFHSIVESFGEIYNDQSKPSFICGEKKTGRFISARRGHSSDSFDKFIPNKQKIPLKREENNLKFKQGAKSPVNHDFELACQASNLEGRTKYLISCKHDEVLSDNYKSAGDCVLCAQEARQRLRAVSLGLFSHSLTPRFSDLFYAARYASDDGIIVQDIFGGYNKPYMRQTLQCLMNNPADLHPLAVAEDANLFWPIIWFWGSVYEAVEDSCNKTTLEAIYHSLGDKNTTSPGDKTTASKSDNASSMAAFPEDAAGEWRIACGNDDCPRVDHEIKFNLCKGCGIRRYCDPACQKKDWPNHIKFCKSTKKNGK